MAKIEIIYEVSIEDNDWGGKLDFKEFKTYKNAKKYFDEMKVNPHETLYLSRVEYEDNLPDYNVLEEKEFCNSINYDELYEILAKHFNVDRRKSKKTALKWMLEEVLDLLD